LKFHGLKIRKSFVEWTELRKAVSAGDLMKIPLFNIMLFHGLSMALPGLCLGFGTGERGGFYRFSFGLLRVFFETCSEIKQAVSKHSRTSPEQVA